MKRDNELIRKLLFAVEDLPSGGDSGNIEIEGYSPEQIGYHAYLLVDGGYAEGVNVFLLNTTLPSWHLFHLTFKGHDFADLARDERIWRKALGIVKEKAGSVSFDVLKETLIALAKGALNQ